MNDNYKNPIQKNQIMTLNSENNSKSIILPNNSDYNHIEDDADSLIPESLNNMEVLEDGSQPNQ